jgi:plastocyanin
VTCVSAGRVLWSAIVLFVLALAVCAAVVVVRDNTGSAAAAPTDPAKGATVDAKNIAFVPGTLTVNKGAEVAFTNSDSVPHTLTADDGSVDTGTVQPGKAAKVTVSKPFAYHCEIHPSMTAKIELSG